MSLLQLDPPLWLYVPERDEMGLAHIYSDDGPESLVLWTVFMDSGVILVLPNERVRPQRCGTLGRGMDLSGVGRGKPAAPAP